MDMLRRLISCRIIIIIITTVQPVMRKTDGAGATAQPVMRKTDGAGATVQPVMRKTDGAGATV